MSLRSLRSPLTRLAIATATGALVTMASVVPAVAASSAPSPGDDRGNSQSAAPEQPATGDDGSAAADPRANGSSGGAGGDRGDGRGDPGDDGFGGDGFGGDGGDGFGGDGFGVGGAGGIGGDGFGVGGAGGRFDDGFGGAGGRDPGRFDGRRGVQGIVTARGGLRLRTAPTRGSRTIGFARRGEIVSIFCQTRGRDGGRGRNVWYLLQDRRTWAWGPADQIRILGNRDPRRC